MASLANVAAQTLQRKIAEEEYLPGDRLPCQRDLASQLGISRTSLREAVSMLEALGMLKSQPGKGVYVTKGAPWQDSDIPLGPSAVKPEDVFQLRYIVEPPAAGLAAINPHVDIDSLEEAQSEMELALERYDLVMASEWDMTFHRRLADQSGNPMLAVMLHQSEVQIAYSLRLPFSNASKVKEPIYEHRKVIQAITRKDSQGAVQAMQAHLLKAANRAGIHFKQP